MQCDLGGAGRRVLPALAPAAAASGSPRGQLGRISGRWTLNPTKSTLGGGTLRTQAVSFYAGGMHATRTAPKIDVRDDHLTGSPESLARNLRLSRPAHAVGDSWDL